MREGGAKGIRWPRPLCGTSEPRGARADNSGALACAGSADSLLVRSEKLVARVGARVVTEVAAAPMAKAATSRATELHMRRVA